MKLGIGSYTYPWAVGMPGALSSQPLKPLQLLEKAQELGVGIVQFGPNLPLDHLPEAELRDVVKHAHSWQIDLEIGTMGIDPGHLKEQIRFAQRVEAILLKTTPEGADGRVPIRAQMVKCLREILNDLASAEIGLAIDNSRIAAQELNAVLETIRNPRVGAALDTAYPLAFAQGWQISARVLGHRTLSLHLKDFDVQMAADGMGLSILGCPVGKGQINVAWLIESFAALRVEPSVILESWTPRQKSIEQTIALEDTWAREGVDYLRRFIAE